MSLEFTIISNQTIPEEERTVRFSGVLAAGQTPMDKLTELLSVQNAEAGSDAAKLQIFMNRAAPAGSNIRIMAIINSDLVAETP